MYRRLTVGRAIVAVAVAVAFALMSWAFAGWWIGSDHAGGDPGGRLMAKLTPLVRVVPGFESGQIPWITGGDANGDFPRIYAMKVEPRWDSCDGMAGTFGWDPALIQVGFQWAGNSASLTKYLNRRLVPRGLTRGDLRGGVTPEVRSGSARGMMRPPRQWSSSLPLVAATSGWP